MRFLTLVIVLSCVLALAATIGTIVVGARSFEGIVVDKPYETGLAWDAARQNKERLGWSTALQDAKYRTGKNDFAVMVRDRNGVPLSHADVSAVVSRPSTRAFDRTYPLVARPDGRYGAEIDLPLYGNWDVIITVSWKNERAGFNKLIYADRGKP
jgi:nitrogen fixation protein FixH